MNNVQLIDAIRSALKSDGNAMEQFFNAAPNKAPLFDVWYKALREEASKADDGKAINNRLGVYAKRYRDTQGWMAPNARAAGGGRKATNPKAPGKVEPSTDTAPKATPVQRLEQYLLAALMVMPEVGASERTAILKAFNAKAKSIPNNKK